MKSGKEIFLMKLTVCGGATLAPEEEDSEVIDGEVIYCCFKIRHDNQEEDYGNTQC